MGHEAKKVDPSAVIEAVIRDKEQKLSECLVERFLESHKLLITLPGSGDETSQNDELLKIINQLSNYLKNFDDENLNKPRVFQIYEVMLRNRVKDDQFLNHILPSLNQIWSLVPKLISLKDDSSIGFILLILQHLTSSNEHINILEQFQLAQPVEGVKDFMSFISFSLEKARNYHTRMKAVKFMEDLMWSIVHKQIQSESFKRNLTQIIQDSMRQNNPSIYMSIKRIALKLEEDARDEFDKKFDIFKISRETCLTLAGSKQNIIHLCKAMAALDAEIGNPKELINKLRETHRFEELLACLRNHLIRNDYFTCNYILGPIILFAKDKTESRDKQLEDLISDIKLSDFNRDYFRSVEDNSQIKAKILKACFVNIFEVLQEFQQSVVSYRPETVAKIIRLAVYSLIRYVRGTYQSNSNNLLNLALEAWVKIMQSSLHNYTTFRFTNEAVSCFDAAIEILIKVKEQINQNRPMAFYLVRILASYHKIGAIGSRTRIVELAQSIDDQELLNEFALILISSRRPFNPKERSEAEPYIKLIYEHMYSKARNTTHPEFLGCVAQALIYIDLEAEAVLLDSCCQFKRHVEIPKLVGDILTDYAPVDSTVKRIFKCLARINLCHSGNQVGNTQVTYLDYLNSPNLPSAVIESLDHLLTGITTVMRGETNYDNLDLGIRLICNAIDGVILTYDDPAYILSRLAKTRILETLYDCHMMPDYGLNCSLELARNKIHLIQISAIKNVPNVESSLEKLLKNESSKSDEDIKEMVELYVRAEINTRNDNSKRARNHGPCELDPIQKAHEDLELSMFDILRETEPRGESDNHCHVHLDCY